MSSEDLKSLIVTDPSLVDEGIDVSGLRTQTDTNPRLLASIADYPGISYDPTSFSYLSDLNELFGYGLPLADTEAATPPATGTPETGDGGGGSGGGGSGVGSDPRNTAEEQRLIDAGIGLQDQIGDPVVALGEIPRTQDELVKFNLRPVSTDFRNQQLVDQGIGLRVGETGPVFAPGEIPVTQADLDRENRNPVSPSGQPIDPTGMLPQTRDNLILPRTTTSSMRDVYAGGDFTDVAGTLADPREKLDIVTQEDVDNPEGLLAKLGITGFNAQEALLKAAINKAVGGPITFVIDFLKDILPPQDPRIGALNELYPDRTSAGTIASGLMAGYNPVSGGFLNTITGGRLGEPTKFGLQEAYNTRIANVRETLSRQYGFTKEELDQIEAGNITPKILATGYSDELGRTTTNIQKLADLAAGKEAEKGRLDLFSGDVDERDQFLDDYSAQLKASKVAEALGLGVDTGVEGEDEGRFIDTGGLPSITEDQLRSQLDQSGEQIGTLEDLEKMEDLYTTGPNIMRDFEFDQVDDPPTGTDRPGGDRRDDKPAPSGPPSTGFTAPTKQGQSPRGSSPAAVSTAGQAGPPSQRGGGGGGGGGGKIVCTMMNESYGFGSFRNKIWIKYARDNLSPEYQKGYHKIFLPLVRLSKKNIVLKKILEHIAVHRTIDIRQESRGKVHVLGRVYRKILEPICYLVGKYAS